MRERRPLTCSVCNFSDCKILDCEIKTMQTDNEVQTHLLSLSVAKPEVDCLYPLALSVSCNGPKRQTVKCHWDLMSKNQKHCNYLNIQKREKICIWSIWISEAKTSHSSVTKLKTIWINIQILFNFSKDPWNCFPENILQKIYYKDSGDSSRRFIQMQINWWIPVRLGNGYAGSHSTRSH